MPSDAFFSGRSSHVISDAAFRAFILLERTCDAQGITPTMQKGRANADFCGAVAAFGMDDEDQDFFARPLFARPLCELIATGLMSFDESPAGVWFIVPLDLVDLARGN